MNSKVIRNLYRAKHPNGGYSDEFLKMICDKCAKFHHVEFKDGYMVIGSLDKCNPFRMIKYSCIKSIQDLGDEVAVVLNSCIIIFNNLTGKININIRTSETESFGSIMSRKLQSIFGIKRN